MRTNQWYGLPEEAKFFLNENSVQEGWDACPHCGKDTKTRLKMEKYAEYAGAWDEMFPLMKYWLKDGGYAIEIEQASPWSSGPMIYTKLEVYDADGKIVKIIKWDEHEIGIMTDEEWDEYKAKKQETSNG